ncbi:hypothetical protein [Dyella mobilis]|uniref:hypothetical protein n=1 Tax=Dyella mobilis TaxID=1849582 RepID=UPI001EF8D358|nr:hypothetical protein [Dyella mobilis]GLQ96039.1 hypothetical protein GCM10007863_04570 [Dyella mobilis]
MISLAIYIGLLLIGLICFIAHAALPFRIAKRLREDYPHHWQVIVDTGDGNRAARGPRLWLRMQQVLRSPAIVAIGNASLTRLWRAWRYSQWLAWGCWVAALALQWHSRA